ncbi:MAG: hypothetical protein ABF242_09915 [Flavobacteriales bacterium]
MHRKLTFIKQKYDLELFRVDEFDANKRLVYNKINDQEGLLETKFKYDNSGNVVLEENFVDGKMSDYTVTKFDNDGEVLSISVFIADELYEKTTCTKTESGEITITTIDGVESSKKITETDEFKSITTEYEFGEFVRKVISEDTDEGRKETIYDENNVILQYQNYEFDENDRILRHEVFSPILEPLSTEIHTYSHGNLIQIAYESIEQTEFYNYDYDDKNNIIAYKVTDRKDNVVAFEKSVFDEENREIEKSSFQMGFQPIDYVMQYEEII